MLSNVPISTLSHCLPESGSVSGVILHCDYAVILHASELRKSRDLIFISCRHQKCDNARGSERALGFLAYCTRLSARLPSHSCFLLKIHDNIVSACVRSEHRPPIIWLPVYKKFYKLCHLAAISPPHCCLQREDIHTLLIFTFSSAHSEGLINEE